jgi:hypothetical protein
MVVEKEFERENDFFTRTEIEFIAKRIFSLSNWMAAYGKPIYYIRKPASIINLLLKKNLADEWDIIQHGFRWYVFLSKDKIGKITNDSRIKITPMAVQTIRQTDFSVEGKQRKLAKELGMHESHLSRIRHRLRRTEDVGGREFLKKEKKELFIEKQTVVDFFSRTMTVNDFFEKHQNIYKIKHIQDVYAMCAERKYFKLPHGWQSIRVGESWLIYYSGEIT